MADRATGFPSAHQQDGGYTRWNSDTMAGKGSVATISSEGWVRQ